MSIPAICHNSHYLFEDGVLEFDKPVEVHVSRFGDNIGKIDSSVDTYPKYDIPFSDSNSFRVFINCNEPITSPVSYTHLTLPTKRIV